MGMDFQLYRAWANTAKGIRECQKADKALDGDNYDSADKHFTKALNCFAGAADHMVKAEEAASVKAGNLLDAGNTEMRKAIDQYADGNADGAGKHYAKALDKYDEALDLIDAID